MTWYQGTACVQLSRSLSPHQQLPQLLQLAVCLCVYATRCLYVLSLCV
jgi:hypothetical protein